MRLWTIFMGINSLDFCKCHRNYDYCIRRKSVYRNWLKFHSLGDGFRYYFLRHNFICMHFLSHIVIFQKRKNG